MTTTHHWQAVAISIALASALAARRASCARAAWCAEPCQRVINLAFPADDGQGDALILRWKRACYTGARQAGIGVAGGCLRKETRGTTLRKR
jgi:hypothetical protein